MTIGNFNIELYLVQLFKKAEEIAHNNKLIGKLIDNVFENIGQYTNKMFDMQNQAYAMMRMLKAWYAREYTEMSPANVLSLIAAGLYIANPIDLIPDFIPFIGKLDDRLVLAFFIKKLNNEIQKFMAWEDLQFSKS